MKVRLLDSARRELAEAIDYYNNRGLAWAASFGMKPDLLCNEFGNFLMLGRGWAVASEGVSCDAFPMASFMSRP